MDMPNVEGFTAQVNDKPTLAIVTSHGQIVIDLTTAEVEYQGDVLPSEAAKVLWSEIKIEGKSLVEKIIALETQLAQRQEIEDITQQSTESPEVTELLDLLKEQVEWAEENLSQVHRREFYSKLIAGYRKFRPKEGQASA